MKIVLTGLGMTGQPMDIPENSDTVWDMVLTQPAQAFHSYSGDVMHEKQKFDTRCRFEWTGQNFVLPDGATARKYVLTEINKL
jgi:hypothetical protein